MTVERLLETIGTNALSATFLFAAALVAQRFVTRPTIRHLLWLAVVVRLLLPPLLAVPLPAPAFLAGTSPDGDAAGVAAVVASRDFAPLPVPSRASSAPAPVGAGERPAALVEPPEIAAAEGAEARIAPAPAVPLPLVLAIAQLLGALVVLSVAAHRWSRFRGSLGELTPAPPALASRVRALADRIGVRRVPRIALTDAAVPPLLFPAPGSTLVLSAPLLDRLDAEETDAILAHELTHVRRGDPWIRPLELLATAFYWWFPLLPFARARLRAAEEAACDRAVIRALPGHARAYAEGLLKAVELVSHSRSTPALATGATDSRELKERIMAIFHPSSRPSLPRWRRALALLPLLAAVSLTPAWVQRDEAPAPPLPPEMPAPLRLRMSAPPALPAPPTPARIPVPATPRALAAPPAMLSAPTVLRWMAADVPDADLEDLRSELDHRRAELELQRELMAMSLKRDEMSASYDDMTRARQLAAMATQLELFERHGQKAEAEELRREYELERAHLERDASLRKSEAEFRRAQHDLELEEMAAELRYEEASLADDRDAMEKAEQELRSLHLRQREMELENMRLSVERARAELEEQQAVYERMAREMEGERDAEADGSSGKDEAAE